MGRNRKALAMTPWCNLSDLRLMPGDAGKALAWFKAKTGAHPRVICVNPQNESLAATEAGDRIKVETCPGTLLWECWLAGKGAGGNSVTAETGEIQATGRNKNKAQAKTQRGRPPKKLPGQMVVKLKAQGLGSREIAKKLGVSHMTVSRALKKGDQNDAR